jgi:hypothetical protein
VRIESDTGYSFPEALVRPASLQDAQGRDQRINAFAPPQMLYERAENAKNAGGRRKRASVDIVMSGKNRHLNVPPSDDQAQGIRAILQIAAKFGCRTRVYPAKGRPPGTKTVVFDGPLPRATTIRDLAYMFPEGIPPGVESAT